MVLYPDLHSNYVHTERGKAAVRVLESLGAHVLIPDVSATGRAPLSQGMISTAEKQAHAPWDVLAEHVEAGRDIVVIQPSDLAMFRHDYAKLLPDAAFRRLRANSFEIMEYVQRVLRDEEDLSNRFSSGDGRKLAYHSHCQQRKLGLDTPTVSLLQTLGFDVLTSNVECCGMAGSFGHKTEYYELSMAVGEELRDQLTAPDAKGRTVVASGTSCQEQITALLQQPVPHPIELIAPPA